MIAALSIAVAWALICSVALVVPSRVRRAQPTVQLPPTQPASEQDDVTWLPYLPPVPLADEDTARRPYPPPVPRPSARSGHDTDYLADQPIEVLLTDTLVSRRCAEILAIEGLS